MIEQDVAGMCCQASTDKVHNLAKQRRHVWASKGVGVAVAASVLVDRGLGLREGSASNLAAHNKEVG